MSSSQDEKMARGLLMVSGIRDTSLVLEAQGNIKRQIHERHKQTSSPPWVNDDGEQIWSNNRVKLAKLVLTSHFEKVMGMVIAINFFLIIFEADRDGSCYPQYHGNFSACPTASSKLWWLQVLNRVFLVIYTLEGLVRFVTFQKKYFFDKWNYLDLFIVCGGWLQELLGNTARIAMFRVFRLARLFRAFKVFAKIRELYLLISGFASSCRAIFFGMIMLLVMLIGFSVMLVELVHPTNSQMQYELCSDCHQAFASVISSTLTLFKEVIAGGSWIISMKLMERSPVSGIILVIVVVVVSLGAMNLILSVIVESAADARSRDVVDRIHQRDEEASEMKLQLLRMCAAMDKDCSYNLTIDELQAAYDEQPDFRNTLKLMCVGRRDLLMIFDLLDVDHNGKIDYKEFCEELYLMSLPDQRLAIATNKHKMDLVRRSIDAKLDRVLSHVDARAESQEKQLSAIELKLSTLMPTLGLLSQSAVSPPPEDVSKEVGAQLDMINRHLNQKSEPQENELSELDLMSITEALRCHLQKLASHHLQVAREVQDQAAHLQQQADLIAKICDAVPLSEREEHALVEVNSPSYGSQMERLAILMAQTRQLSDVLGALQRDAIQLGFSAGRVGDLLTMIGNTSSASGWVELDVLQLGSFSI